MNKLLFTLGLCISLMKFGVAQEVEGRPITTAVPFLSIAADPRAAGLGDQGVATTADAFSQQWNPAKYAFIKQSQGVGVTYTPYLSQIVDDIFLGQITYFNRINERSAFGTSFRYFSLGDIEIISANPSQGELENALIESPNEFTLDLSYALRLSDRYSMAVSARYLRSDLKLQSQNEDASAAGSIGVDIAGFYQSAIVSYNEFDGRWRGGFNISNIGPKIRYDDAGQENFIPTNLRLGGGFDFILDQYNTIGLGLEFNKLLVPSPQDFNGNGEIGDAEDRTAYQSIGFLEGMFQSFGDAPNGFSEELKEVTWSLAAEYRYDGVFAFRTGYFNESNLKGSRKFATLGLGFKYSSIDIDVSYLFSTTQVRNPLENTLRFGLTFNFGNEYEDFY